MRDFTLGERWKPGGECWQLAAVQAGSCANILRDKRALALAFTNCHMQESGRPIAPVPSMMSDATFAIYTEFFTHTEHLCFHLQSEHYQQRANEALKMLGDHAHDWLYAMAWARAIATFLGGVAVLGVMGKAAAVIKVPRAKYWTRVAHGVHIVVQLATLELTMVLMVIMAVYQAPRGTPVPPVPLVVPVPPVPQVPQVPPAKVLRRSCRIAST